MIVVVEDALNGHTAEAREPFVVAPLVSPDGGRGIR